MKSRKLAKGALIGLGLILVLALSIGGPTPADVEYTCDAHQGVQQVQQRFLRPFKPYVVCRDGTVQQAEILMHHPEPVVCRRVETDDLC